MNRRHYITLVGGRNTLLIEARASVDIAVVLRLTPLLWAGKAMVDHLDDANLKLRNNTNGRSTDPTCLS